MFSENLEFNLLSENITKKIMSRLESELDSNDPKLLNELLHLNQSLLSAIDGKKELLSIYNTRLPFSKLIRALLEKQLSKS